MSLNLKRKKKKRKQKEKKKGTYLGRIIPFRPTRKFPLRAAHYLFPRALAAVGRGPPVGPCSPRTSDGWRVGPPWQWKSPYRRIRNSFTEVLGRDGVSVDSAG
jgi:hypothetical protein